MVPRFYIEIFLDQHLTQVPAPDGSRLLMLSEIWHTRSEEGGYNDTLQSTSAIELINAISRYSNGHLKLIGFSQVPSFGGEVIRTIWEDLN